MSVCLCMGGGHVCKCLYACMCAHVCVHVCACVYACVSVYVYMCVCESMCVCGQRTTCESQFLSSWVTGIKLRSSFYLAASTFSGTGIWLAHMLPLVGVRLCLWALWYWPLILLIDFDTIILWQEVRLAASNVHRKEVAQNTQMYKHSLRKKALASHGGIIQNVDLSKGGGGAASDGPQEKERIKMTTYNP